MKQQLYDHQPPISKTIQIRQTRHAGHGWRNKDELHKWCSPMDPLHMDVPVLADKQEPTYNNCMDTRWSLEDLSEVMDDRDKWREESEKSMPSAQTDDEEEALFFQIF